MRGHSTHSRKHYAELVDQCFKYAAFVVAPEPFSGKDAIRASDREGGSGCRASPGLRASSRC